MNIAHNPIIRGFNPDPSIIRVGDDYYIANSTFEWFPGVQIHHSTDLVNWELVARPLNRKSQLDLLGAPDSCGVWAPCLTYEDGIFYLVYSNVRSFDGIWKDTPNYLVTTSDIKGEWSEPVFLNSSGFDGSMFHDFDGRKWYSSMLVDHRDGKFFGGIILQEFDYKHGKLCGPVHYIFEGTNLGKTEGPHIYKRGEYYYLLTAEGGTEYGHAISIARSKNITGPYEVHPNNPMISSMNNEKLELQKAGHGDLVETQNGDWYAVFLVGRPLTTRGRCILGRETAIEKIIWKNDGWPYLEAGGCQPRVCVEVPGLQSNSRVKLNSKDDFENIDLDLNFQSLRIPMNDEWLSLTDRPGFLRLFGQQSLTSIHNQSLIARRLQSFDVSASTCLDFHPETFQQMAGLVCYYNTGHYHYLSVSWDEKSKSRILSIYSCDNYHIVEPLSEPLLISTNANIYLKVEWNKGDLQFYHSEEANEWSKIGPTLDASILSDDYVTNGSERYRPAFTGSFIGLCCQDLTGNGNHADFDWFEYEELDN